MSTCKSCGNGVIWARTPQGKAMPVSMTERLGGNIELIRGEVGAPIAIVRKPDPNVKRHISHFVDCPNAKQHRRPR